MNREIEKSHETIAVIQEEKTKITNRTMLGEKMRARIESDFRVRLERFNDRADTEPKGKYF